MRALIKQACTVTVQTGSVVEITAEQLALLQKSGLAEALPPEKEKPAAKTTKKKTTKKK